MVFLLIRLDFRSVEYLYYNTIFLQPAGFIHLFPVDILQANTLCYVKIDLAA